MSVCSKVALGKAKREKTSYAIAELFALQANTIRRIKTYKQNQN